MWGRPRRHDDPYWAEQGKAWIEYAPGKRRLVDLNAPQGVPVARSSFPAPALLKDSIEPCLGMDGKMHDSLSSYRKTLRADGNPMGETFTEIGNESLTPVEYKFDRAERREDIKAALADVKAGKPIPAPVVLED